MFIILGVITGVVLTAILFFTQKQFGRIPSGGKRLERIERSANYRNGHFRNLQFTPVFAGKAGRRSAFREMLFGKDKRSVPTGPIPSVKRDLAGIDRREDLLVWLGHSSVYLQVDGKRILIDPVLSGSASPVPFLIRAFEGASPYTPADFPPIDYLIITHDHWDHLDYQTVINLKFERVICPLGVGEHLERWGVSPADILEGDWGDSMDLGTGYRIYLTPARHFSGRGLRRNKTLWTSYVLETPSMRIFISGDGGYGDHFARIGERFGSFDLALLENGQYNELWRYIHLLPEQTLQAARNLRAQRVLPIHNSRFSLANHAWDEPLRKITELNRRYGINLVTPIIGEVVPLRDPDYRSETWWESLVPRTTGRKD